MKNNKGLGQHWLKNRAILEEIAELAGRGKLCVEIGPGLGFLTSSLLKRFDKVIAVEYDVRLAEKLPGSFPGKNLEVVNGDILKYDLAGVGEPYVVAGNIPYYITSPIIERILTSAILPERVVLLVQKEVAERIVGSIGGKDGHESVLSLFVKNRARILAGPVVPAAEFTPPPKVDSQVIVMEPFRDGARVPEGVFGLIKQGFASPRKKLVHNLVSGAWSKEMVLRMLATVGVSVDARPGDVSLEEWAELHKLMQG